MHEIIKYYNWKEIIIAQFVCGGLGPFENNVEEFE